MTLVANFTQDRIMVANERPFKTPSSAIVLRHTKVVQRGTSNAEVAGSRRIEIETDRIDETVLALPYLSFHEKRRLGIPSDAFFIHT